MGYYTTWRDGGGRQTKTEERGGKTGTSSTYGWIILCCWASLSSIYYMLVALASCNHQKGLQTMTNVPSGGLGGRGGQNHTSMENHCARVSEVLYLQPKGPRMRSSHEEAGLSLSIARCRDSRRGAQMEALDWTLVLDSSRRRKIERSTASSVRYYNGG